MVVYKDKLISSSNDRTIKIWDLKEESGNINPIRTWEGHTDRINNMLIYKDKLISCSCDKTIKIWNLNLKGNLVENVETYNIHTDNLTFCNGYLYGYRRCKIKIFKYQPYFEDYKKLSLTIPKIMNSKRILFRNEWYKGKLYKKFENYQRAILTIFKIMNSSCISYRNKLYKGRFYKREVNKIMEMYDTYNSTATKISTNNFISTNKISSNNIRELSNRL